MASNLTDPVGWTVSRSPQEPEEAFVKIMVRSIALILILLASAATAESYPLSVDDHLGRVVVLDRAPQRVVSMIPSHTEIVCAIGACELLVGIDQFSNFPAEVGELPRLGSAFTPNIEGLVALEPDLVLVDEDSGIVSRLEELGIPVWAGTAQTYEEVFEDFANLGRLLDRETEAAVLAGRVRGEVQGVGSRIAGLSEPTVYFELDSTPYSVGPGSFIDSLITRAGGLNIVGADLGPFPQLDPEFIVAADPAVIVLADAPYGETAESVAARPGWRTIDAVVAGRVVELTSEQVDALSRPGPRLGEAVIALARIFHPDRF